MHTGLASRRSSSRGQIERTWNTTCPSRCALPCNSHSYARWRKPLKLPSAKVRSAGDQRMCCLRAGCESCYGEHQIISIIPFRGLDFPWYFYLIIPCASSCIITSWTILKMYYHHCHFALPANYCKWKESICGDLGHSASCVHLAACTVKAAPWRDVAVNAPLSSNECESIVQRVVSNISSTTVHTCTSKSMVSFRLLARLPPQWQ